MWVGLGGGLGSVLRWWIGRLVGEGYKGPFPFGTFLINISGSFAIGYLSVLDWLPARATRHEVLRQSPRPAIFCFTINNS